MEQGSFPWNSLKPRNELSSVISTEPPSRLELETYGLRTRPDVSGVGARSPKKQAGSAIGASRSGTVDIAKSGLSEPLVFSSGTLRDDSAGRGTIAERTDPDVVEAALAAAMNAIAARLADAAPVDLPKLAERIGELAKELEARRRARAGSNVVPLRGRGGAS
jgi:hypothetical protein